MRCLSAALTIAFSAAALLNPVYAAATNEAKEIAVGTLSCKAEWNEFCEDQNIVSVPAQHKLCHYTIKASTQTGDSTYQFVTADNQSVTVKFSAKGNRDRFNQQGAQIVLTVSLFGVRNDASCPGDTAALPAVAAKPAAPVTPPAPTTATPTAPATAAATPAATAPVTTVAPTPPALAATTTAAVTPAPAPSTDTTNPVVLEGKVAAVVAAPEAPANTLPKIHACACSQWIDAGKVTSCLELGSGRDKTSCDTFAAAIQCVTSREDCRAIQQDTCYQVMGLNQTTSQKRIFVSDSPYCINKIKK